MANPHPKPGPGRPKKGDNKRNTEMAIRESAPYAAAYLKKVIKKEEKPQKDLIDVAKYIVNQTIGMAATKAQNTEAITITIKRADPPIGYIEGEARVIDDGTNNGDLISTPGASQARPVECEAEDMQSWEKVGKDDLCG